MMSPAAVAAAVKLSLMLIFGRATAALPRADRRNFTWSYSSRAISVANCLMPQLAKLTSRGATAVLAIRVTIHECFFHCAKAFIRSQLWKPETWSERMPISFGNYLGKKIGADEKFAEQVDKVIEEDYNSVDPSRMASAK